MAWAYLGYAALADGLTGAFFAWEWFKVPGAPGGWLEIALLLPAAVVWPTIFPAFMTSGGFHRGGVFSTPLSTMLTLVMIVWTLLAWWVLGALLWRRLRGTARRTEGVHGP